MNSLYIHIPFCRTRCIYCDFYSTTLGEAYMQAYIEALGREMLQRKQIYKCTRVHTIYIGGGTPSLLPPDQLTRLFNLIGTHFTLDESAEVTIEANPDDVRREWIDCLKATPVNRISMGVQTFNDGLLRLLGRRHDAKGAVRAVRNLQKAGFHNISIDLIYGLPGQSMDDWRHDVHKALALDVKHLSAYSLSYEDGTPLDTMLRKGLVSETDEELSRQMYNHLMDQTSKAGFQHYEISNFALPGFRSRHNSSYWNSTPYLGLGAGAHSYDGQRTRRANLPDVKAYLAANGDVPHEDELLSNESLYNEFIMTRLRTSAGIPLDHLSTIDKDYCLDQAKQHLLAGRLNLAEENLKLTRDGIFTSNDIISDLMK